MKGGRKESKKFRWSFKGGKGQNIERTYTPNNYHLGYLFYVDSNRNLFDLWLSSVKTPSEVGKISCISSAKE